MKLDRNITNPRRGKYALIKLREATVKRAPVEGTPLMVMVEESAVDFGDTEDSDFFVIRMKDMFAGPALRAYAHAISEYVSGLPPDDPKRPELTEYHHEIINLAEAAHRNVHRRIPD